MGAADLILRKEQSMSKTLDEFLEMIDDIVRVICTALIFIMTVVALIQVFARYVPAIKPPAWTEEFARYTMIWLSMMAASHGIRMWNNVGVDFVLKKIPGKAHKVMDILIKIAVLVCLIVVTYLSITVYPKVGMKQISATLRVPMFYAQLGIIVGFILCCVQLVGRIIIDIAGGNES